MFDPDLLDHNPIAREAIKLLVQSEILDQQLASLKKRLGFGSPEESDEDLAKTIKEFRRQYGIIESLRSLGERYIKENEL